MSQSDLTEATIKDALEKISKIKEETGMPLFVRPTQLVFPDKETFERWKQHILTLAGLKHG